MPWANVRDNVRLPLKLARAPAIDADARIEAALEQVGLAEFATAYPRELSGGMKMRVSLARALVTDPDILLMDEPFAALDEITRSKLNNDLLALWRAMGMTVVFVTHSVFESVYLANRIVVMTPRPGRVFAALDIDVPIRTIGNDPLTAGFQSFYINDIKDWVFNGYDLRIGVLYKFFNFIGIGGSVKTPSSSQLLKIITSEEMLNLQQATQRRLIL